MAGEQGRCPNCGSDQVVRAGKYNRGEKGVEQSYLYRSCYRFSTRLVQQLELIKSRDLSR